MILLLFYYFYISITLFSYITFLSLSSLLLGALSSTPCSCLLTNSASCAFWSLLVVVLFTPVVVYLFVILSQTLSFQVVSLFFIWSFFFFMFSSIFDAQWLMAFIKYVSKYAALSFAIASPPWPSNTAKTAAGKLHHDYTSFLLVLLLL